MIKRKKQQDPFNHVKAVQEMQNESIFEINRKDGGRSARGREYSHQGYAPGTGAYKPLGVNFNSQNTQQGPGGDTPGAGNQDWSDTEEDFETGGCLLQCADGCTQAVDCGPGQQAGGVYYTSINCCDDTDDGSSGADCFDVAGGAIDCGDCSPGTIIISGQCSDAVEEEPWSGCSDLVGNTVDCGGCPEGSVIDGGQCIVGDDDDEGGWEGCSDVGGSTIDCGNCPEGTVIIYPGQCD